MQWDHAQPHCGFTSGRPWLPVGAATSVREQDGDATSLLSLCRRLLVLRRSHAALVRGTIEHIVAHGDVLTYERRYGDQRLSIAINMGGEEAAFEGPAGVVTLSTSAGRDGQALEKGSHSLAAGEAVVVVL